MSGAELQGLSEAQIEQLAQRLAAYRGALSLESVDGLFCALIAAPQLILPSDYLPVILGDSPEGAFESMADAQEAMGLLMRYWNAIAADFEQESIHLAYVLEPGTDGILGRDWARGYMRGTRLSPQGWNRIFGDDREGLVLTIPVVAGEVDPDWPRTPLTPKKSDENLQHMLAGAARAYRYFKPDRLAQTGASIAARAPRPVTFERESPKIGRNDPCPCGSGKKYKKCCGRTEDERGAVH